MADTYKPTNYHVGETFNRLTIVSPANDRTQPSGQRVRRINVTCVCGVAYECGLKDVVSGHTKSCGCYNIERIKERKRKVYNGVC